MWWLIPALAIGYGLSFWGLIGDMERFRAKLHQNLIIGDVTFASFIAVAMPFGWVLGIKNLIGLKIDWDESVRENPYSERRRK